MFKRVGSGVCRVEGGGSESRAGELGKSLIMKGICSFIHSFNTY